MKSPKFIFLFLLITFGANAQENFRNKIFNLLSDSLTNIKFANDIKESMEYSVFRYSYFYNGGGVAIGDINNDGLSDIYFTSNMGTDKLYLNKGNFVFEDITNSAIIQNENDWRTGVTMVDVNEDGFLDIYVSRASIQYDFSFKTNILYINNKDLTFTEQSTNFGLADSLFSIQAAFFDADLDGDLDAYVMNFPFNKNENNFNELGHLKNSNSKSNSDHFYENINGTFSNVSEKVGIHNNAFGLGLCVSDLNNDGYTDIYVSNDYEAGDFLYINENGVFLEKSKANLKHISNFGMGIDLSDFNNDGLIDIIQLDMAYSSHQRSKENMPMMFPKKFWDRVEGGQHYQYMLNSLQLNNGNVTFSDIALFSGVAKTNWSWGSLFADFDNDGFKDIIITNGYKRDITNRDLEAKMKSLLGTRSNSDFESFLSKIPELSPNRQDNNYLFRNKGDLTFENKTTEWGFDKKVNSNGVAYGDLDNDGDLDLVINNLDEVASVYENTSDKSNGFLDFKLTGTEKNRFAIGTRITIYTKDGLQIQELFPTRGFQSSVDYKLHFGVGKNTVVDKVEIRWPDLKVTVLKNVKVNQILQVDYHKSKFTKLPVPKPVETMFNNFTENLALDYTHKENHFNDFDREVLLPHMLSRQGPCLAVADVNQDGLEDMFIGGAKESAGALYLQTADNKFTLSPQADFTKDRYGEDVGALFFDFDNDKDLDLYVTSGGNDYKEDEPTLQDRLYINQNGSFTKSSALPDMRTSTMTVKAFDFDSDGDLDLFVGGRLVPGKYPKAPRSYLLKNEGGKFIDVTAAYCKDLMYPGMVTGAEFGDVNGDGKADLTLIGEWMPLLVFLNKGDKFEKLEHKVETESLWFSLHGVDLDKDGDLDFVGGNLGKNCKFKGTVEKPFNIYADDFDGNGTWDMMMSFYEGDKNYPVRGRDCSSQQMPSLVDSFPTFKAFAIAEITEICGPKIDTALHLTARGFYTSVFMNDGKGNFTMKKLPNEAQFSPTLDIHSEDLNKDGHLDLILVGNMYDVEVETVRYDAGRGVVLMGDGKGSYTSIPPTESGFFAWDNVKAMKKIKIGKKEVFLLTVNNGKMLAFEKK